MSDPLDWNDGLRLLLDHSQSGVENSLTQIENLLQRWEIHAGNLSIRKKLIEELNDARWLLRQHFDRLFDEGYLARAVELQPHSLDRLQAIEEKQTRLVQELDSFIDDLEWLPAETRWITRARGSFHRFHMDLLNEELEERILLLQE